MPDIISTHFKLYEVNGIYIEAESLTAAVKVWLYKCFLESQANGEVEISARLVSEQPTVRMN